jgi:hypothetical protein
MTGAVRRVSKEEYEARRKVRKAEAKRERRRAKGTKPRAEYLANHQLSQTKPWEAEGISRATYYRRQPSKPSGFQP